MPNEVKLLPCPLREALESIRDFKPSAQGGSHPVQCCRHAKAVASAALEATRPTIVGTDEVVERVVSALKQVNNAKNGWGETLENYPALARAAIEAMPTVVTGERPLQSVGDHALPPSGLSPCGSQAKPAAAIARRK